MTLQRVLLAVITLVVILVAWQTSRQSAPTTEVSRAALYPDFVDRVNDVTRIRIATTTGLTELARRDDGWVVANRGGYPATVAAIKQLLLNVAATHIIEKKTALPARYAAIGVAGLDQPDSVAKELQLLGDDDTVLAALLVGNERNSGQINAAQYYVRKTADETALLVEGDLDIDPAPASWMDTAVLDIPAARIARVRIERNGAPPVVVAKAKQSDNFFELENIPAGFEPKSRAAVSGLGAVLLDVKFEDVASATEVKDLEPRLRASITTFDGLVVTIDQLADETRVFSRLAATFDPAAVIPPEPVANAEGSEDGASATDSPAAGDNPAATTDEASPAMPVAEEAAMLNARFEGWAFVLPDYKNRMLDKQFDDLVKKEEAAPSTPDAE